MNSDRASRDMHNWVSEGHTWSTGVPDAPLTVQEEHLTYDQITILYGRG
jgi:hypothetical protein